ncbi:MAG: arylsulfatase [Hyphomicrobiales bacterium]|nr:MAG: arylsulfatase [Hyphomicrobiales bacterium]
MKQSKPRIALIHATLAAKAPVEAAFEQLWPEADRLNLVDDKLSPDRARDDGLTAAMERRIGALADYAMLGGADAILYTCSAFGPAIQRVASRLSVPVLRPNEAMFDMALGAGGTVGMLATFAPAVPSMEAEFAEAAQAGGQAAQIRTVLAEGAMDALNAGNEEQHNALVAAQADKVADCGAVMLAHFSTSRARRAVEAVLGRPVLTSPDAAVAALRKRMEL